LIPGEKFPLREDLGHEADSVVVDRADFRGPTRFDLQVQPHVLVALRECGRERFDGFPNPLAWRPVGNPCREPEPRRAVHGHRAARVATGETEGHHVNRSRHAFRGEVLGVPSAGHHDGAHVVQIGQREVRLQKPGRLPHREVGPLECHEGRRGLRMVIWSTTPAPSLTRCDSDHFEIGPKQSMTE